MKPRAWALVVAAGRGSRMGAGQNKVFETLAGQPVLWHALRAFFLHGRIQGVCVVHAPGEETIVEEIAAGFPAKPHLLAEGGITRQESVLRGLRALKGYADIVLVHDAARPLVDADLIDRVLDGAMAQGACVPCLPVADSLKAAPGDGFLRSVPREGIYAAQTPQGFSYDLLLAAYEKAQADGAALTDDASVAEHAGHAVAMVMGKAYNRKMTLPEDLEGARALLEGGRSMRKTTVGLGMDWHRLVPGRPLVLCGVLIPYEKGLLGHSDADVALHAVMDALLGAAGLGDIGLHFPDSDARYKGASSMDLLHEVARMLRERGYQIGNVDVTVVAQKPKLAPFREQMQRQLSEALGGAQASVKFTTTEGLGPEGAGEAISAQAVTLLHGRDFA